MKVAILGRTRILLRTAELLLVSGFEIPLVWTCPSEQHYGADVDDFRIFAHKCGARFLDDRKIDSSDYQGELARHNVQLAVSVNWPTMIPGKVIEMFSLGILNAHAGDLPRYRGNACPNWAILQGEPFIGLCIHQMTPTLDSGPVIVRDRFALAPDAYIGEVYDWLETRIPALFLEAVQRLLGGQSPPRNQSEDPATILRCYPRRPEDGRIEWSSSVEAIYRLIRASSRPFGGAYTSLEGERKVTIFRAKPVEHYGRFLAVPGQVAYRIGDEPVIACGDGMLQLTEVEVEGIADPEQGLREIHRSLRNRLV